MRISSRAGLYTNGAPVRGCASTNQTSGSAAAAAAAAGVVILFPLAFALAAAGAGVATSTGGETGAVIMAKAAGAAARSTPAAGAAGGTIGAPEGCRRAACDATPPSARWCAKPRRPVGVSQPIVIAAPTPLPARGVSVRGVAVRGDEPPLVHRSAAVMSAGNFSSGSGSGGGGGGASAS